MKNIASGIYIIRNSINDKVYIGSSCNCPKRFKEHRRDLLNKKHHSIHLQRFADKYGVDCLSFELFESCEKCDLLTREQYWLDFYKSYQRTKGFNISHSSSNCLGVKHTEETKEKHRKRLADNGNPFKGRRHTEEVKQKLSKARKGNTGCLGRKMTEKVKEALKKANVGRKFSEEHLRKLSESSSTRVRKPHSEETKAKLSLAKIGQPSVFQGKKHSEQAKQKMSKSAKGNTKWLGKKHSEESKIKMSAWQTGRKLPEQQRLKIIAALTGKKQSQEVVDRRVKLHIGKKRSDETRAKQVAAWVKRKELKKEQQIG